MSTYHFYKIYVILYYTEQLQKLCKELHQNLSFVEAEKYDIEKKISTQESNVGIGLFMYIHYNIIIYICFKLVGVFSTCGQADAYFQLEAFSYCYN